MTDIAPSPAAIVDDATGRKVVYDVVSLQIIPEQARDADADIQIDVMLLHGMTPNGRKVWGVKDHGPGANTPQQDAKSIAKHARKLAGAMRVVPPDGCRRVAALRLIMPDRPGYGGSDVACAGIGEEEGAVAGGYSYREFARDMRRVLEHAGSSEAGDGDLERRLILLGTSSGGPGALALREHLLSDAEMDDAWKLREFYGGGVAGTILCSSDCPYKHPECPPEILAEDEKGLRGRSTWEYVREESCKNFRRNIRAGWITDYTLERMDWGFEIGPRWSRGAGGGPSAERRFCSPAVHIYVGGERDFKGIRLCAPFLQELIGEDATLEVMEDQDHFYASRKPAVLAKMLLGMVYLR